MVASALLLVSALWGAEPEMPALMVGDPAPALALSEFIKGEPVEAFQKDKVYVLEFWATWCEQCIRSMPHLSKLQARFPDATFIGVDVMDDDLDAVKEFVEAMGEQMDFRVAIDAQGDGPAPEGESPLGRMNATWLETSHRPGALPQTFIVDGAGRVAWIGHPLEVEKPLAAVVDGTWDLAAEREKFRAKVAATRLEQTLNEKIDEAFSKGDAAGMRLLLDEYIQAFPEKEGEVAIAKLMTMLSAGDAAQAEDYFTRLLDEVLKEDWRVMLGVTGFVTAAGSDQTAELPEGLRPQPAGEPLLALAFKAANRAVELASADGAESEAAARDTLARVYYVRGEIDKAVQEQETAIGLARGTQLEGEPGMRERLGDYRRAKSPGGKQIEEKE